MGLPNRAAAATAVGVLLASVLVLLAVPAIATGTLAPADGICGPGGTARTVADVNLDAEQLANANTITTVTHSRGLPPYAATVALATAMQESKLRNLQVAVDHDSLGLFQQRVMHYTAGVAADPGKATNAFLDLLVAQPDWQTRPLTDVAADIQRPLEAYRGLYAQWQPLAAQLTAELWSGPVAPETGLDAGGPPLGAPCAGSVGTDSGATPIPGPSGLTLTGSTAGNAAATYALAQLGKPYVWGAEGPGSFDCSGLMMAAWASVGMSIPRVTYTQATTGAPVSPQDTRTGDLVLIPGSDGTPANPGHVGMVAGVATTTGAIWLVEAPRTAIPVRLTPITGWANQIVTIRRVA